MRYESIETWNEPRKEIDHTMDDYTAEMSIDEQAFLCGIIKKYRPVKVVEVGVAEGGGTVLLITALKMLCLKAVVYSVDLSEDFYMDSRYKTGYIYNQYTEKAEKDIAHQFLFGKTLAERIEEIGGSIDMVILDTAHFLPGELMDFICILPYMRMGGVVVLHDTQASVACSGNLKSPKVGLTGPWRCCCTQILFACTKGKKYINFNSPNIAAIEVGIETWNNIYDAVWALGMTWGEMPDKETLDKYMEIFSKKYDKQCNDLFHRAVSNNRLIHNNLQIYGIRKGEVLENFSHVFIG